MNIITLRTTRVVGLILLIASFVAGQSSNQKIDELLSMLHNQQQFNGIVLIADKGKVSFKKSYGTANEDTKRPIDENTVFELASVSKQFTAMAIVILKERGKLGYDDKITKFFPELGQFKDITVRNLLNHTSGIPDYINPDSLKFFDENKFNNNQDVINYLVKGQVKPSFEPDTKFQYSNTGYVLLASIVEKVSKMSFGDFLKASIFKPLKLKNTFVYMRRVAPRKIDNYAFGYIYSKTKKKLVLTDESINSSSISMVSSGTETLVRQHRIYLSGTGHFAVKN